MRQFICGLGQRGAIRDLLEKIVNPDHPTFRKFLNAFLNSGLQSIDAFLARNPQYEIQGTAAIAAVLIAFENPQFLNNVDGKIGASDWYGYLWNRMVDGITTAADLRKSNNVSFVTFNYERSLEMFLQTAIQHSFGVAPDQAHRLRKEFDIHHVYGSLGELGYGNEVAYGTPAADDEYWSVEALVKNAANSIKVVPAIRHEAEDEVAKQLMSTAERIIFLGFSFDSVNCERLGIRETLPSFRMPGTPPSVFMTTYGMTASEVNDAKIRLSPSPAVTEELFSTLDKPALAALREWGLLL